MDNRPICVEFRRFSKLDRHGTDIHSDLFINAFNDVVDELILFEGHPGELFRMDSEDLTIELRSAKNPMTFDQLKAYGGFYFYDEWVPLENAEEKREGLCRHCFKYAMVRDYNGKPCCDMCIMTIQNQRSGKTQR